MKSLLIQLTAPVFLLTLTASAAPLPVDQLQPRAVMDFGTDFGTSSSIFNPVYSGSYVIVNQINNRGFGLYNSGWGTPLALVYSDSEHRMVKPFPGSLNTTYLMGSSSAYSGANTTTFTRYNFDGTGAVTAPTPGGKIAEGFDWVDDQTVIHTAYDSGYRKLLYLVKVTAEPFALEADTRWNANGYVSTSVSTRIRNVRKGDVYSNYVYYGDAGQNTNPKFFALNIATGVETELGNAGTLTGTGSFGVWTVMEKGGYLYVHTTDNGIQVYSMTSATAIGSLLLTYDKATIDAITGQAATGQYWGFDVSKDGSKFLLGGLGNCFEFGAPELKLSLDNVNATLLWPSNVTAVAVQSATTIAPGGFADIDPQPPVMQDGKTNFVQIPATTGNTIFRLRKNP